MTSGPRNGAGWLWRQVKKGWLALWGVLWNEKTPLLVTIILTVSAAYLSPLINEQFERQKMRSEYVLSNLKDLNSSISDLYVDVTDINYAVAKGNTAPDASVQHARDTIAKLNWKLIETAAMLPPNERGSVMRFQTSVVAVSNGLRGPLNVKGCEALLRQVNTMALDGALVIQDIGRHVEISDS